ncbi:hypothetical protein GCM10029978_047590 [Actinoallomurus acanthiterrae]
MTFLESATAVIAPKPRPYQDDPKSLRFFGDLLEPFDQRLDEERLRAGTQISHRDLLDALLPAGAALDPADLVIVAHGLPDLLPFAANASHLNLRFGEQAHSFAISGQGLAAPFTALRIIAAYQAAGKADRAAVAVLEQTTLPTPHPLVDAGGGLVDSGVLLVFARSGDLIVERVRTLPSGAAVLDDLRTFTESDPHGTLVVCGPSGPGGAEDPGLPPGTTVQRAAPGAYSTSVWLELARAWRQWSGTYRRVVLTDVDPRTGDGHVAVLRCGGNPVRE